MGTEPEKTSNELAVERTDLAADRTLMAADRSLMAWIRTALSMISFGFTIYKVLASFQQLPDPNTPRSAGLFLIGLGTASMIMGVVEYWQRIKRLQRVGNYRVWSSSFVIALIMSLTGATLLVSIIRRLL